MKKEQGVTIISLIVTIIVLIILAGVSINLTLGQNGIITKAKQAKENMEIAQIEEQKELNELYVQLENNETSIDSTSYDAIAKLAEFKRKIASAITNKGIQTSEDDSADTMAKNITDITSSKPKKYLIKDGIIQDNLTFTGARNSSGSAKPTATQASGYISVSGQGAYTTTFDVSNYSYLGARMSQGTTSGMGTFASSTLVENNIHNMTHGSATNPASYLGDLENKTNAYVGIYVYASASQSLKLYDLWLE